MINLTGKQKSQILISMLEETSSAVLNELSEESSAKLSESLEDVPELNNNDEATFLDLTLDSIKSASFESSSSQESSKEQSTAVVDDLDISNIPDESESIEVEESTPKYPENYRKIEKIAEKLSEQDSQIIAFFLSQIDEHLNEDIKEHLNEDILESIKLVDIEIVPISKKVFKKLFDYIVIKKEGEDSDEESNENLDDDLNF